MCEGERGRLVGAWLTTQVLQYQVELVVRLECIVQTDYGGMLDMGEREGELGKLLARNRKMWLRK